MNRIDQEVVSAECDTDWVTIVTESSLDGHRLRAIAEAWFARAIHLVPWHMRGYHGRRVLEFEKGDGGLAYGERLGDAVISYLLQAWGAVAHCVALRVLGNQNYRITRMDYAVSVLFEQPLPAVAEWEVPNAGDRRLRVTRIIPNDQTGGTLYVGSRGSDMFGRVYDKGAQLGTIPGRLYWRWEVEYKGQTAKQAFGSYAEKEGPEERAAWVKRCVSEFYGAHSLPFPPISPSVIGKPVLRYATRVLCNSTTIQWMQQQVAPAIKRLAASGQLEEAFHALGIDGDGLLPSQSEIEGLGQWAQLDFLKYLEYAT